MSHRCVLAFLSHPGYLPRRWTGVWRGLPPRTFLDQVTGVTGFQAKHGMRFKMFQASEKSPIASCCFKNVSSGTNCESVWFDHFLELQRHLKSFTCSNNVSHCLTEKADLGESRPTFSESAWSSCLPAFYKSRTPV